jgi:preprotein translocase subunit SecY
LRAKLLFTIAVLGLYEVGLRVPLPGVDRERLFEALPLLQGTPFSAYDNLLRGGLSKAAIFSLGIMPYITASIVLLLLSGAVRHLRKLRDERTEGTITFDRFIYVATAAIASFQGWGLALFLQMIPMPSGHLIVSAGLGFRIQTVVIVTTGAVLVAWMADQITRRGLANGVALIILLDLLADAIRGLNTEVAALAQGGLLLRQAVLFLFVIGGLFALSVVMVRAQHRIPLQYTGARDRADTTWTPSIVLRTNTVGIVPVGLAGIAMLPLTYVGVRPQSAGSWIAYCGLIVFFTYLWTAVTFSGADVLAQVRRYGFALADVDPATALDDYIDRIVERRVIRHAALLTGLVLAGPFLVARLGIGSGMSWLASPSLLVIAAIGVAIMESVEVRRQQHHQAGEVTGDWFPVFEAETELEVDLARGILERAGIPTARFSNRAVPVTGTLAFWEVSRPVYPSLTIYRRLGGGSVYAEVRREHVEQAVSVLASYHSGLTRA